MPNLRSLDCSYTAVCHAAFTGCGPPLAALESLDMSGCSFVTDQCVQCLVARIPDTAGAGFILYLYLHRITEISTNTFNDKFHKKYLNRISVISARRKKIAL